MPEILHEGDLLLISTAVSAAALADAFLRSDVSHKWMITVAIGAIAILAYSAVMFALTAAARNDIRTKKESASQELTAVLQLRLAHPSKGEISVPVEDVNTKENPGCWTRRRAFAQVRHGSNIQLLPYSLVSILMRINPRRMRGLMLSLLPTIPISHSSSPLSSELALLYSLSRRSQQMNAPSIDPDKITSIAAITTTIAVLPTVWLVLRKLIGSREERERALYQMKIKQELEELAAAKAVRKSDARGPDLEIPDGQHVIQVQAKASQHGKENEAARQIIGTFRLEDDGDVTIELKEPRGVRLQLDRHAVKTVLDNEDLLRSLFENEDLLSFLLQNREILRFHMRQISEAG
jgi:hypothetical protein